MTSLLHERKFFNRWIVMEDDCLGKDTQILNLLLFRLISINGKCLMEPTIWKPFFVQKFNVLLINSMCSDANSYYVRILICHSYICDHTCVLLKVNNQALKMFLNHLYQKHVIL